MIPRSVRAIVPRSARRALRRAGELIASLPDEIAVMRATIDRTGAPRVYYGRDAVPGLSARSHGGLVKVQHMQSEFPNSVGSFNILYMVSSQPPRRAGALARRAHRRGARVVWNQDGVAYPAWHGPGWERTNAEIAPVLRTADHVFYQSAFCRQGADLFVGPPRGGAEVLHNPVDTALFTPRSSGETPEGLVLLAAGTHQQRYRFETAVAVLARVREMRPDATLLVAGRLVWGPDEGSARREADGIVRSIAMEDAVRYLGPFTQQDAPAIYRRAHLLIHAQVNDASPGVVLEAMSCGLPIVHSKSGGVPELVGDEAGVGVAADADWDHITPPDPDLMAGAVLRVAADLGRYADAARARAVARFDLGRWLERHRSVFTELLS